eukprot:TRINITY_DN4763_c0_g2_i2.p1 TRINITY_DN4763_c0_g2~~TRINITY_DN4763_c0_g2_i2.p1  ORF type:complete len:657 (+),score=161.94 TRINITY_DN4763_c0_g2_i2:89-2059(+)
MSFATGMAPAGSGQVISTNPVPSTSTPTRSSRPSACSTDLGGLKSASEAAAPAGPAPVPFIADMPRGWTTSLPSHDASPNPWRAGNATARVKSLEPVSLNPPSLRGLLTACSTASTMRPHSLEPGPRYASPGPTMRKTGSFPSASSPQVPYHPFASLGFHPIQSTSSAPIVRQTIGPPLAQAFPSWHPAEPSAVPQVPRQTSRPTYDVPVEVVSVRPPSAAASEAGTCLPSSGGGTQPFAGEAASTPPHSHNLGGMQETLLPAHQVRPPHVPWVSSSGVASPAVVHTIVSPPVPLQQSSPAIYHPVQGTNLSGSASRILTMGPSNASMVHTAPLAHHEERLSAVEGEIRRMRSERDGSEKAAKKSEEELKKVQEQLAQSQSGADKAKEEFQQAMDRKEEESAALQVRVENLARVEAELQKTLQVKARECEASQREMGRLTAAAEAARRLEGEKRQVESELERERLETQRLKENLQREQEGKRRLEQDVRREKEDSARTAQEHQLELQDLRMRLAATVAEAEEARKHKQQAEERCRKLEKEGDSWLQKLEVHNKDSVRDKALLQRTVEDQRRALRDLELKLRQMDSPSPADIFSAMERGAGRAMAENTELKDQLVRRECDLELAQSRIRQLQEEMKDLKGSSSGASSELLRMRNGGA